ncbi:MAG: methyltransferase domain-containing protein [Myxococcota bacterium]|nr:methyltransferase domain-containing protein [Myxococcota bacterium]
MAEGQRWDPDGYERHARFVTELGAPVRDLLAPRPGERILDLGCGDGALTANLVAAGSRVVGIDASPAFVAAARARGLDARVGDGHALAFDSEFDAVFSNAALHWMREPDRVLEGVHRALVPGGRFVAEFGGAGCVRRIVAELEAALAERGRDGRAANPWYFPSDVEYRMRLERNGFEVREIRLFARPTPLPGDVAGWLETFCQSFTNGLPEHERPGFLADVQRRLEPALRDAQGVWHADYVRLRFAATKPA